MADDDLFTTYLFKLQETHLQTVNKLKEEVGQLTKKYQRIRAFANENACLAKKYHSKCRSMLNKMEAMKTKIKELTKDRMCQQCKAIMEEHPKSRLDISVVTSDTSDEISKKELMLPADSFLKGFDEVCKQCKVIIKGQPKSHSDISVVMSRSSSSVLSSTNGTSNPSHQVKKNKNKLSRRIGIKTKTSANSMMSGSPLISNLTNENLAERSSTLVSKNHCSSQENQKSACEEKPKLVVSDCAINQHIISVPETIEPGLLGVTYDDDILGSSDVRTPDVKLISERTKNWISEIEKSTVIVPDTCAFQDDDITMLNTQGTSLKSPKFCSTQIVHDVLPKISADMPVKVEDDDLTMIHTHDTLKAPQFCSTPTVPKVKNLKHVMKENSQVENHVMRQSANRRTSLPKSESQYPVDLVNTQIPSPTFQKDVSPAVTNEDTGKCRQSVTKNLSFFAQKTPMSGAQKGNESFLSDTSPFLLRASNFDSQKTAIMDKFSIEGADDLQVKGSSTNTKKRKLADVDKSSEENIKCMISKSVECKRNKQEHIVDLSIEKYFPNQQQDVNPKKSNSDSPTGHKLVQKTLTMMKGGKSHSIPLIKMSNGGIIGSSENDVYLKQAIEKSKELKECKTSDFKKPFIPADKRTQCQEDNDIENHQYAGDSSFLNGTIDPAIDLSNFKEYTPQPQSNDLKNPRSTSSTDQKPTSVVMTSGMICIINEVPCIQGNLGTKDLPKEISPQRFDRNTEEDGNLSNDDMFAGGDDEPVADASSKQDIQEPDTSDEISNKDEIKLPADSFLKGFDDLPSAEQEPQYKYVEVVRKQADRRKLRGFECKDCEAYFSTMDLTDSQKADRMKSCSRHRAKYSPPSTQPHYWDVDFPDTETCLRRGYMNNAPQIEQKKESPKKLSRISRRKGYKQLFKSKSNATSSSKQEL